LCTSDCSTRAWLKKEGCQRNPAYEKEDSQKRVHSVNLDFEDLDKLVIGSLNVAPGLNSGMVTNQK
jgi:hypothetical protein